MAWAFMWDTSSSGVSVAPQEQTAYPPDGGGVGSGMTGGVSTGPGSVVGAGAGSGSAGSGVGAGVGSGSEGTGDSGHSGWGVGVGSGGQVMAG